MRSMMNVDNYLMLLLEETKHQQYSKWREVPNGLKWTILSHSAANEAWLDETLPTKCRRR